MQDVAIRLAQRMRKHPIAHEAAVDEKILRVARGAWRERGAHDPAGERQPRHVFVDVRGLRRELAAEQRIDACRVGLAPSRRKRTLPLCWNVNATSGCASAMRRKASSQWPYSVASVRRNLRRAGVLKNSSFTVTVVPARQRRGLWHADFAGVDLDAPRVRFRRASAR